MYSAPKESPVADPRLRVEPADSPLQMADAVGIFLNLYSVTRLWTFAFEKHQLLDSKVHK